MSGTDCNYLADSTSSVILDHLPIAQVGAEYERDDSVALGDQLRNTSHVSIPNLIQS